tara:strand:- start:210 stop:422 length:213 start_codon:yes stop_codon:yes gene_type:complete
MKKEEEEFIVEFLTIEGIEIKVHKGKSRYTILVSDGKKKSKLKKVYESLDNKKTMSKFFNICNHYTKQLD